MNVDNSGGRAMPGADRFDAASRVGEGGAGTGQPTQAHGFPSPAQDYFHGGLDLNRLLVRDRTSTFLMRVEGQGMAADGMMDGDEVIVDRSLHPRDRSVVVAVLDGELTLRRWHERPEGIILATDDGAQVTRVGADTELVLWGVVTRSLHHV
ncbi:LexA family protein [Galactobacter caseinivorans]|nr:translesion error-prone DNA polymerase V autoproteolytic subunit [Galactobacter caseinivorans]